MNQNAKQYNLPWKQGDDGGFNANRITDSDGNSVCECYGIPLHVSVEEMAEPSPLNERWEKGMERAQFITTACNQHVALVAVAEAAGEVLTTLRCVNDFDCLKGVSNLSRALEHLQSLTKGEK